MRRLIFGVVGLVLAIAFGGCATLRGMAEDLQNLGKGLKESVSK